jgi:hypothetical protein
MENDKYGKKVMRFFCTLAAAVEILVGTVKFSRTQKPKITPAAE